MNIILVCSGNICRSPMAEYYLRSRLQHRNGETRISSAGTLGIVNDPAADPAIAVMACESRIDLSSHRSRGINREMLEDADVVLVMEARHRRYLRTLYPNQDHKVHLLSEYVPRGTGLGRGADIFDPVGMEPEAFQTCYRLIRACLDQFVQRLDE